MKGQVVKTEKMITDIIIALLIAKLIWNVPKYILWLLPVLMEMTRNSKYQIGKDYFGNYGLWKAGRKYKLFTIVPKELIKLWE